MKEGTWDPRVRPVQVSLSGLRPIAVVKAIHRYSRRERVEITSGTVEISLEIVLFPTGIPGGASIVGLRLGALPKFLRRPIRPPALVGVADIGLSGPTFVALGSLQPGNSPSAPAAVDGRRERGEK